MQYVKTNLNPTGKEVGDCVVRAIQLATKQNWTTVYVDLCELGKTLYRMPNDKKVYALYLAQHGFEKAKQPKKADGKMFTVAELIDYIHPEPNEPIVISTNKHLTVVVGYELHDIWDCRGRFVRGYWTK